MEPNASPARIAVSNYADNAVLPADQAEPMASAPTFDDVLRGVGFGPATPLEERIGRFALLCGAAVA